MKKSNIEQLFKKDTGFINGDFETLFNVDIKRTIGEYFSVKDGISVQIQKGTEYSVVISFTATDVKSFGVIPK